MIAPLSRRPSLTGLAAAASIANSAYLVFVNLEAFFGLRDAKAQAGNFIAVFGFAFVALAGLLFLAMIRRLFARDGSGGSRVAALIGLGFAIFLIAPFAIVGLRYFGRAPDPQLHMVPFLVFEVVSILYLIQLDRGALARRRLLVCFSWFMTLLVAMNLIGVYDQWLGGAAIGNDLSLVYGAILFHLFNASLLFHGFAVAREKRMRRALARVRVIQQPF